jgi:plastocyanin
MSLRRRDLLAGGAAALATGLAGCSSDENSGDGNETSPDTGGPGDDSNAVAGRAAGTPSTAVATEWNAYRARLWDAHAMGVAGDTIGGTAVAQQTFGRFEGASGEYGAHEMLEETSSENYEEFEEALGELRAAGLQAGDMERAGEEAAIADTNLGEAQERIVQSSTADALDLQLLGVRAYDAAFLAAAGNVSAAETAASRLSDSVTDAEVAESLEATDSDALESFETALDDMVAAAQDGNPTAVRDHADAAFDAAVSGSYALAASDEIAGAGHVAALQARGWDAAALASMGGPALGFAHAATRTIYRARLYDSAWLVARGEPEMAATIVSDIFAHFEGARAHEGLEEADHEAYEGFEGGLEDLQGAIQDGDATAIQDGFETVDANLVTGIDALAGANAPLLEAAFFRARLADARELYRLDNTEDALTIANALFARFETNELDFHETVESTSEDLYTRFEETHLGGLVDAIETEDDAAVTTHYDGAQSALLEFETTAGSPETVSGAEGSYVTARAFDAAVLDTLGEDTRASDIAQDALEHFESGAGGFHEALEHADHAQYEAFEEELEAIAQSADAGEDVYPVSKRFNTEAVPAIYAIVEGSTGSHLDAATTVMQETLAHFENAQVHELLESADHNAYHTFEGAMEEYITALQEDGDVSRAATTFADAAQYAQFALVDSVEKVPVSLTLAGMDGEQTAGDSEDNPGLTGGPNVVDGVPDEADHVVDMNPVSFDPESLTVEAGDTVAWKFVSGEPHTVTAYEEGIPEDAAYWASGEFDSEDAARTGWENSEGAIKSGQSYVHTFETTGTHEYVCIPHEAAGMVGTIVVE